jgi:hypothetical protein
MEKQKCYFASFNVGDVEVHGSELYLDKKSVFLEIKKSKDDIFERIECFSIFITKRKFDKIWNEIISDMEKHEKYGNREYQFDFFILERPIWENYKQKERTENGTD